MDKNFKDPSNNAPKSKEKKSPWDFTCPEYDERSSCYVNAGTHHGVGKTQPVGHAGNAKQSDVLPMGDHSTMKISEIPKKNLKIGMES